MYTVYYIKNNSGKVESHSFSEPYSMARFIKDAQEIGQRVTGITIDIIGVESTYKYSE